MPHHSKELKSIYNEKTCTDSLYRFFVCAGPLGCILEVRRGTMESARRPCPGLVAEVLDLHGIGGGCLAADRTDFASHQLGATRLSPVVDALARADVGLAPGVGDVGELWEVLVHRRDIAQFKRDVDPIIVDLPVAGEGRRVEADEVPAEAGELLAGGAVGGRGRRETNRSDTRRRRSIFQSCLVPTLQHRLGVHPHRIFHRDILGRRERDRDLARGAVGVGGRRDEVVGRVGQEAGVETCRVGEPPVAERVRLPFLVPVGGADRTTGARDAHGLAQDLEVEGDLVLLQIDDLDIPNSDLLRDGSAIVVDVVAVRVAGRPGTAGGHERESDGSEEPLQIHAAHGILPV